MHEFLKCDFQTHMFVGTHWNVSLNWVDTTKSVTAETIPLYSNSTFYMNESKYIFPMQGSRNFRQEVRMVVFAAAISVVCLGKFYGISLEV